MIRLDLGSNYSDPSQFNFTCCRRLQQFKYGVGRHTLHKAGQIFFSFKGASTYDGPWIVLPFSVIDCRDGVEALLAGSIEFGARSRPASGSGRPGPSEANSMMASTPLNGLRFAPNDQPCLFYDLYHAYRCQSRVSMLKFSEA
jgi:hypothetical protein